MRPPEPGATRFRYSAGAILFHWTIAILIIANLIGGVLFKDSEGPVGELVMGLHKATGFTILFLSLARLAWRLAHRPPPFPGYIRPVEAVAARIVHWLFYILMIGIPLSGWIFVSVPAERHPFIWYGLFDLPFLPVQGEKALGDFMYGAHGVLGWLFIGLLALHVAGALKHQIIDRHPFIGRMWPSRAASR